MRTFLIALGLALVTALTLALVGPRFVDWNFYRASIEAGGERLLGRPVRIGGDLEVTLLPRAQVTAADVRMLGPDGGEALVSAERIALSLDLGRLILGSVEVTDLVLTRPSLRADSLVAGLIARDAPGEGQASATRTAALRRIEASGATLTFDDPLGGRAHTIVNVDFSVTASTLAGPFKLTGEYGLKAGEGAARPAFSASLGAIDRGGPINLSARVAFDGLGDASLDGEISSLGGAVRYKGKVALDRRFPGLDGAPSGRAGFAALADVTPGEAELTEIAVTASDGANAFALSGSGRASWSGAPRFSAELGARQVDLDGVIGEKAGGGTSDEIGAIASALGEFASSHGASGRVQLDIDGAIWRGEIVRDIAASIELEPGRVSLTSLQGYLPGETEANLSGVLNWGDGGWMLDGDAVASTIEADRLVRWIAPKDGEALAAHLAKSRGRFSLRGVVHGNDDGFTLENVEGIADGSPFTGAISLQHGEERAMVRAALAFDAVDLDRYLPPNMVPADLLGFIVSPGNGPDAPADFTLGLEAKRALWRGREARQVALSANVTADGLDIASFAVEDFAGAGIGAYGQIEDGEHGPAGSMSAVLTTDDLPRFLEIIGYEPPNFPGRAFVERLEAGPAEIEFALEAGIEEAAPAVRLAAVGLVSGVAVDIGVSSDASLADFTQGTLDVQASLEADDAARLIGPDGLYPLAGLGKVDGAARTGLTASGKIADGLEVTAFLDALGGLVEASGQLAPGGKSGEGAVRLEAVAVGPLASAFGLAIPVSAAAMPARLKAGLKSDGATVDIDDLSGVFAGNRIAASAHFEPGPVPALDLAFDITEASLPWLGAAIFGPRAGAAAPNPASAGLAPWPSTIIDTGALGALTIEATGTASRLVVTEGLVLTDGGIAVTLMDGTARIDRLEGGLGDGRIGVTGTISGEDDVLALDGTLTASGVPLGRILTDPKRRALVDGAANFEAEFTARGRSLLSLVSTVEGSGTLGLEAASLPRFDAPSALGVAAIAQVASLLDTALSAGRLKETQLGNLSGKVEAANGRIRVGPMRIAADATTGEVTSFLDLAARRFDQAFALERDGTRLSLVHAGPVGEVTRSVEADELPGLGAARWSEPLDALAVPEPEPVPEPEALPEEPPADESAADETDAGEADGEADGEAADGEEAAPPEATPELPPLGLIEQQILDLPILEEPTPPNEGGRG